MLFTGTSSPAQRPYEPSAGARSGIILTGQGARSAAAGTGTGGLGGGRVVMPLRGGGYPVRYVQSISSAVPQSGVSSGLMASQFSSPSEHNHGIQRTNYTSGLTQITSGQTSAVASRAPPILSRIATSTPSYSTMTAPASRTTSCVSPSSPRGIARAALAAVAKEPVTKAAVTGDAVVSTNSSLRGRSVDGRNDRSDDRSPSPSQSARTPRGNAGRSAVSAGPRIGTRANAGETKVQSRSPSASPRLGVPHPSPRSPRGIASPTTSAVARVPVSRAVPTADATTSMASGFRSHSEDHSKCRSGDRPQPTSRSPRSVSGAGGRPYAWAGPETGAKTSMGDAKVQSWSPSTSPRSGSLHSLPKHREIQRSSSEEARSAIRNRSNSSRQTGRGSGRAQTPTVASRSRSESAALAGKNVRQRPSASASVSQKASCTAGRATSTGRNLQQQQSRQTRSQQAELRKAEKHSVALEAPAQPKHFHEQNPPAWFHWQGEEVTTKDLCPSISIYEEGNLLNRTHDSSQSHRQDVEHGVLMQRDCNSPKNCPPQRGAEEKLETKARDAPLKQQGLIDETLLDIPGQVSPSPSAVDLLGLGSLACVSSVPSLLSGGGVLELSDSVSHPSLTFSTNSSCREDASSLQGVQQRRSTGRRTPELMAWEVPKQADQQHQQNHQQQQSAAIAGDENQPPVDFMEPTPRTFHVAGQHVGNSDPLARTVKTVSTMRYFWEEKVRKSMGGAQEESRPARRSQSEHPRRNRLHWMKEEISWLRSHMEQQQEFCEALTARARGPEAIAGFLDDGSPVSKANSSFESDLSASTISKNKDSEEDDNMKSTIVSFRHTVSQLTRYNRKAMDLCMELLERFPQQGQAAGCQCRP
eukprot:TRINITY_DN58336_c0_g1_i1.p1 TRINITY_DN58336_c0_g1~~TRINITY_DN58336_c0_g1_i1.p1  ORF type:complete len:869 (-),score=99.56 TRINITY_DN58336_c0_g1_i1:200-2806(-)